MHYVGLLPSVCAGVVSKVVKAKLPSNYQSILQGGPEYPVMLETTAAIHPGGSGGAVINQEGHMIGLVTRYSKLNELISNAKSDLSDSVTTFCQMFLKSSYYEAYVLFFWKGFDHIYPLIRSQMLGYYAKKTLVGHNFRRGEGSLDKMSNMKTA